MYLDCQKVYDKGTHHKLLTKLKSLSDIYTYSSTRWASTSSLTRKTTGTLENKADKSHKGIQSVQVP